MCFKRDVVLVAVLGTLISIPASGSENGASVYPAGVETVMPGMMPPPGGTEFVEFSNFYQANMLVDGNGKSEVPGFHLRVGAVAPKVVRDWGVYLLGGYLVSSVALPVLYEHLSVPGLEASKSGLSNPDIGTALAYGRGNLHWWYGVDVYTPAPGFSKSDPLNIGQHNWAAAPSGAFSYVPRHAQTEISSKFQYIVNATDAATNYRSGNEFVWEFDGMQNVTKKLAIGTNGFYYQQTTNDLQNGLTAGDGNRGRDLGFGPELRYHMGRAALILKYERDFLVENRPAGNSFWFQLGLPIGHIPEH